MFTNLMTEPDTYLYNEDIHVLWEKDIWCIDTRTDTVCAVCYHVWVGYVCRLKVNILGLKGGGGISKQLQRIYNQQDIK